MKKLLLVILLIPVLATSCIKEQPENREADILTVEFPADSLLNQTVIIQNNYVKVYPKEGILLTSQDCRYTVTEGATSEIINVNATLMSDTLFLIKVTSQDGQYSKCYAIRQVPLSNKLEFDLNTWIEFRQTGSFPYVYENPKQGFIEWSSSNNGASTAWLLTGNPKANDASAYPIHKASDGSGGYLAEITTLVGPGKVGPKNVPCMSGSLYLGTFDQSQALSNTLRTTQFGIPYRLGTKPKTFTGYYKYTQGTDAFINGDGTTDNSKQDSCDIYAVLFKTDKNNPCLYGDNIKDSPNIIAKAQITHRTSTLGSGLQAFSVEFDYNSYTTPYSDAEMLNGEYKITIVCTSSTRGAYYEGRPGSILVVDNLKILSENEANTAAAKRR